MKEILPDLLRWHNPAAVATVIETWGSAPRQRGAKFAMTAAHELAGSVSGGCIEGAVFEEGLAALETGRARLVRYGVSDETAFEAVGLMCGGSVEVFVEPVAPLLRDFWRDIAARDVPGATATVIAGPDGWVGYKLLFSEDGQVTPLQSGEAFNSVTPHLMTAGQLSLRDGQSRRVTLHTEPACEAFVEVFLPAPQLVLVGAVHIAIALAQLARTLGFRVIVIDPREAFGNETRFPDVDQLIRVHPPRAFEQVALTRSTAVVMLTHDEKFDDPSLRVALDSPAFYIGALGSKRTHSKRLERLRARGLSETQLARIHGPLGLDLGASSPEEIALATLAQIVAARNARLPV
jgi:xanthine dehydrogenase accessory factor